MRDPLKVIPSMLTLRPDSWEFALDRVIDIDDDPLGSLLPSPYDVSAVLFGVWTRLAHRMADRRVRIEDVPEVKGLPRNSRPHATMTEEDLHWGMIGDYVKERRREWGYT